LYGASTNGTFRAVGSVCNVEREVVASTPYMDP
jgi:hypothetical protein